MAEISGIKKDSVIAKYQTLEGHKLHLREIGQMVIDNDFSRFTGDDELLKLKKEVAYWLWLHPGFENVEQMSKRFDSNMPI